MKNLGGLRKFSIAMLGVALVFVCSSCGGVDAGETQISNWMTARVSANDDLLQKLKQAGVLSDAQ